MAREEDLFNYPLSMARFSWFERFAYASTYKIDWMDVCPILPSHDSESVLCFFAIRMRAAKYKDQIQKVKFVRDPRPYTSVKHKTDFKIATYSICYCMLILFRY